MKNYKSIINYEEGLRQKWNIPEGVDVKSYCNTFDIPYNIKEVYEETSKDTNPPYSD